ncbi:hypothetical protein JTB14_029240 [Gonioctena quinquepunctata]|nr:hypothetical protein JTB14_029240 [Gonioctena quinquepunctata]
MLNPEVFTFPAPESLFQIEKFEGKVPLNNKSINNFYYNHLVTVICPESVDLRNLEENFVQDSVYYKIPDFKLEDLADVRFISGFVRSGKLTLLSIDKRIDCDNCIGVTPNGWLHLNLTKDTYQSLGIDGHPSHFSQKLKNRYDNAKTPRSTFSADFIPEGNRFSRCPYNTFHRIQNTGT